MTASALAKFWAAVLLLLTATGRKLMPIASIVI
jgi:hypothetical protein